MKTLLIIYQGALDLRLEFVGLNSFSRSQTAGDETVGSFRRCK